MLVFRHVYVFFNTIETSVSVLGAKLPDQRFLAIVRMLMSMRVYFRMLPSGRPKMLHS